MLIINSSFAVSDVIPAALGVDVLHATVQPSHGRAATWLDRTICIAWVAEWDCIVRKLVRVADGWVKPGHDVEARAGFSGGWHYKADMAQKPSLECSDFCAAANCSSMGFGAADRTCSGRGADRRAYSESPPLDDSATADCDPAQSWGNGKPNPESSCSWGLPAAAQRPSRSLSRRG
jgi:hypothetical protein